MNPSIEKDLLKNPIVIIGEEIGTKTLYINDDRLRLPRYEKRIDTIVIQVVPEDDNDELVWTVYYTPEIGMAGFKFVESGFFTSGEAMDYVDNEFISKLDIYESLTEKISDQDYSQSKKGVAYKVFRIKNGKLYPPMVANPGGGDTPVGVWLDAEEGEFAGLSKTGRKKVKSTGSGDLAYRPGWHLGDVPRAKQFDRSFSWTFVNVEEDTPVEKSVNTYNTFIKSYAKSSNIGKIYYVKDVDAYVQVVNNNAPYFPYDFIWAECEYVMDINYQDEADEQGYMRTKPDGSTYRSDKYQHSLAGLPKLPTKGYYKYRTNPNPDTVPWVITGAIKVTKLLDDFDVRRILGNDAPERQGGDKTLSELGLQQI